MSGVTQYMGWEDRDYARGANSGYSGYSGSGGGASGMFADMTPAVKAIIIANVIFFIAQVLFVREMTMREFVQRYDPSGLSEELEDLPSTDEVRDQLEDKLNIRYLPQVSMVQEFCSIHTPKVMRGEVWRLITGGFCHDRHGIFHILFNMLFLFWFGSAIERIYGTREFACFYFAALFASSCAYVGLDLYVKDNIPAIGASGAVMAVTMLCAIHYPRKTILVFFIFPIEVRWMVFFYCIYDLHPVLLRLSGEEVSTGVAHMGHLGGLAFGYLYWRWGLQLEKWLPNRSASRSQSKPRRPKKRSASPVILKMHNTEDETGESSDPFDLNVDEILRKIQREGKDSLTDEEKATLERASKTYGNRD